MADLLVQVPAEARVLHAKLHLRTVESLADLVRVMNCHYSNLIEGHDTRPRDIERALAGEWATDARRKNLQMEAEAHIRVQREIDHRFSQGTLSEPTSEQFLRWAHREFYRGAPPEELRIGDGPNSFQMVPGEFRRGDEQDNAVGRHQPPSSDRVPEFMEYFSEKFRMASLGPADKLLAVAIAHHRLNYIHPFPDGNGRVSRLMSHAMAHVAGIGAGGLWSISRGLARGVTSRTEYKSMMDLADSPREGDLDGRGNLSRRCLEDFVAWFLEVCLDQLKFMSAQFELSALSGRLRRLVDSEG